MSKVDIKEMLPIHWKEVSKIYKEGIDTGLATFEKKIPTWKTWDSNHLSYCRLIALINNNIVGWAALSPVSSRCIYGGVAEISVYVANGFRGNKIGEKLLQELIRASERNGLWTIQSGVFPENTASIELHKKVGFRVIGYREKVGVLDGKWKDNILMERRSKIVGV
jgi:phosphinothricin acetyltransferase